MPWTFYNASGQKLSSAATSINVLDIDGATDIGAAIVDADLFIIDDGAGGTNRKTAASRIKTYIGTSAVAREGGVVTEATTTATSLADLLAIGSLTIDTGEPIAMFTAHRKTTGSANKNQFAFEMNTTIQQFEGSSTTNQAENGTARGDVVGRDSNYLNSMEITVGSKVVSGSGALASAHVNNLSNANPNAQVTTLTVQGMREGSAITVGADEFQAYTYAIS